MVDDTEQAGARVVLFRGPGEQLPAAVTSVVHRAVAQARAVELDYVDAAGSATCRTVDPAGLVRGLDGWYLAGWCRLRGAGRWFRLDRVVAARVLDEPAAVPAIRDLVPDVPAGYARSARRSPRPARAASR